MFGVQAKLFYKILFLFGILVFTTISCNNSEYYPKPRGYFRIDLPEKNYRRFDSIFPYSFSYPQYAKISFDEYTRNNPYWMNLDYPKYKGRVHLSYKSLKDYNLYQLTEDAREMTFKHASKAVGIKESVFSNPKEKVYGLAYQIQGKDAASPYQFYLTDSTHHFIRGALYFNVVPNNDSLQPVIDLISQDLEYLANSFRWK
jgi:gliding motility-associated lipoprotein GldD